MTWDYSLHRHSPGRLVAVTTRAARKFIAAQLENLPITTAEHPFLCSLLTEDGCSQDELAARLFLDKSTTARALSRLEKEGLIRREPVDNNRRMNRIFVTDKGREVGDDLQEVLMANNRGLTRGLSDQERKTLRALLLKLEDNARNMAAEVCGCK